MKKILSMLLIAAMMLSLCGCSSSDYKKAVALFDEGDYAAAYEMFIALGDYNDSPEMATQCQYELATDLMEKGDYKSAATAFGALGNYAEASELATECEYQYAVGLVENNDYEATISAFEVLGDYKDSAQYIKQAKWGMLYDYIQENGTLGNNTDTYCITKNVSVSSDNDSVGLRVISIFRESDDSFTLECNHAIMTKDTSIKASMIFCLPVALEADTAEWEYSFGISIKTSQSTGRSVEKGTGTVNISTCTIDTMLEAETYEFSGVDINGVKQYSDNLEDGNINEPATSALYSILTEMPTLLAETGLPITMADLGFTAVE